MKISKQDVIEVFTVALEDLKTNGISGKMFIFQGVKT
jgi:hypothetical protein